MGANMKTRRILITCLILTFLTACQSIIPTPTTTPTTIPTQTFTPTSTSTSTPTPTFTPSPTPTSIGGSEPKVAFVGKDPQGNLGIYIDTFYTGKPEKISSVFASVSMRWSPDGQQLMYWDENEYKSRGIFMYDVSTEVVQEVAKVPGGKDVFDFNWSSDGNVIYFTAASRSNPTAVHYKLDLSNGQVSETKGTSFSSNNSHVNSGATNCDQASYPKAIYDLSLTGAYQIACFYPELNAYSGLEYNDKTTNLILFTQDGKIDKTLAIFPAMFWSNGYIDLLLSPDKSQILIIGEGQVTNGHTQFSYATQLANLPLDKSSPEIWKNWNPIHVFGWSPDSLNYLVADQENQFAIIQASSGMVAYKYKIQNQVEPAFSIGQGASGYDMIWPVSP